MNHAPELRIGHLPWRYASGRLEIPGLRLVQGTPWRLRAGSRNWDLIHVRPEEGPKDPGEFARHAKAKGRKDALPFVLGPYVREDTRRALETEGVSYFDFYGNAHIAAPGVLVHVQMPVRQEDSRVLGIVGIRGAQTLLSEPQRPWGVTELAHEAEISAGAAQNVMRMLESEALVYTEGKGPARKRRVTEPGRFLDWLNLQRPARDPRTKLSCSLYARTPDDLWNGIERRLEGVDYAITGAAAASILNVSPTSVPRTAIRIATHESLRHVAIRMGAEPTERGANLVLWSDAGRLGVTRVVRVEGKTLAPKVRIYLDLHADTRGADLASEFRERVLGY